MKRRELPFFAEPQEQSDWLKRLLVTHELWCVAWKPGEASPYQNVGPREIDHLNWTAGGEYELILYFGNPSLTPAPVWEGEGKQLELDFIRSQTIEYLPSLAIDGNALLMGQLSIMPNREYTEAGIEVKPLVSWFQEVCSSFRSSLAVSGATVIQTTTSGAIKRWNDIMLTSGAIQRWNSGKLLKQYAEGNVVFDVEVLR